MDPTSTGDDLTTADRAAGADPSEAMLRDVLNGETYDAVAARHGLTRTGVERRIKALALRLATRVGIAGLNADGAAFVGRLRNHREAVLAALALVRSEGDPESPPPRVVRVLSEEEIAAGARRLRARSARPLEDLALYYLMLNIGARPLEIARLQVLDYLAPDGTTRTCSELRAEVTITGRARPMFFLSQRLCAALDEYLAQRVEANQGRGPDQDYRGLDPLSRLFLSPTGSGFEIAVYLQGAQRRYHCRAIQEAYRKIWRYADFKQLTTLDVRHTVADRLYARGADEMQVGLLLGISERAAVREMFPRRLPTLEQLTRDLV